MSYPISIVNKWKREDYVKENLLIRYDGYHKGDDPTKWPDLSGHGIDATVYTDSTISEGTYFQSTQRKNFSPIEFEKGDKLVEDFTKFTMDGTLGYMTGPTSYFFATLIMGKGGDKKFPALGCLSNNSKLCWGFVSKQGDIASDIPIKLGEMVHFAICADQDKIQLWINGIYAFENTELKLNWDYLYAGGLMGVTADPYSTKRVHSFRVYTDVLTPEQIQKNYYHDKARFSIGKKN